MFEGEDELKAYLISNPQERRYLEYKGGGKWDSLRLKILKASLGMANFKEGGYIIIGVQKPSESTRHEIIGMGKSDARMYTYDTISSFINSYAYPHIDMEVEHFYIDKRLLAVIQINEFKEMPVICKKSSPETKEGRIYYRRTRQMESSPDLTAEELREIIEAAVDKGMYKQMERIKSYVSDDAERRVERKLRDKFAKERARF